LGSCAAPSEAAKMGPGRGHTADFHPALPCTPDGVVGLAAIDVEGRAPLRMWAELAGAQTQGCKLSCSGWAPEAKVHGLTLSWLATTCPAMLQCGTAELGSRSSAIEAAAVRTMDVHFQRAFDGVPSVAPIRIDTWTEEVCREGFRVCVRTWEDSVIWGLKLSWVATPVVADATTEAIPPHQPPAEYIVDGPPLGQGWCAVTHRAKHSLNGQVYAVKTSKYPFKLHEQHLRQELDILERLPVHQNVLRYHHFILHADDRLHIVTEFLNAYKFCELVPSPGGSFKGVHTEAAVLQWIASLLDGLAHLHTVGLVHRDLHGENVLVERDAKGDPSASARAVRIIDFGAAGLHGEPPQPRLMSQEAGCFQYCSPERRSKQPIDDRDDVWAAACHLTELASGKSIRQRPGCGSDGSDFAFNADEVQQAALDCELRGPLCRELAEALLVRDMASRPRAAVGHELAKRLLARGRKRRPVASAGSARPATAAGGGGRPAAGSSRGSSPAARLKLARGETPPGSRQRLATPTSRGRMLATKTAQRRA